jgi:hypothetical protein
LGASVLIRESWYKVFTAAPVPEPATWVLLIGPLPILALLRSRRREALSKRAAH